MWYLVALVIWMVGVVLSWPTVVKWDSEEAVKLVASMLWPLTLVLYGIYCLYRKASR